jgi:uncharacterized repeat protein (TIGR03803 family)
MSIRNQLPLFLAGCILVLGSLAIANPALAASKEKVLYSFKNDGVDGRGPYSGLTADAAGNLYGTTQLGGAYRSGCAGYGCGTVFELSPSAGAKWTETVLYSFTGGDDGSQPYAGLIFDTAGNLYGTTGYGGDFGQGTVFELAPEADGTWTETVLHGFAPTDGSPLDSLIFDAAGNLYGTTVGTVFELSPSAGGNWIETVLYTFCSVNGCRDGRLAYYGGLLLDTAGNLYGTTTAGGNHANAGVVFELAPSKDGVWTETVLHRFHENSMDGEFPLGSVIFDAAGHLYGTTWGGGVSNAGTVFELKRRTSGKWREKEVHLFGRGQDGRGPYANVIFSPAGNLYGTTSAGGVYGGGTVFKLKPGINGSWSEKVLHSFGNGKDGAFPLGGLILDGAGHLYGTSYDGGAHGCGTVFEITP